MSAAHTALISKSVSIFLSVRANSQKDKVLIVFKEKEGRFPPSVEAKLSIPSNMDIACSTCSYINNFIFQNYVESNCSDAKVWIVDRHHSHISASTFRLYQSMGVKYIIIPGGCTEYLQPLDIEVMRSFESKLEHQKTLWISENVYKRTKAGNMKNPTRQDMINLVSWEEVDDEILIRSFKLCKIVKKDEGEADIRFKHTLKPTKAGLNLKENFSGRNPWINPLGLIHKYSRVIMEGKPKIVGGGGALQKRVPQKPKIHEPGTKQIQEDSKYTRYQNWLRSNGCIYPSLEHPVVFENNLIGVMAKTDIPKGKAVSFVPYTVAISVGRAKNSEIGHLFEEYPYWYAGHSGAADNIIWTFMVFEKLKGPNSFWFPYFDTTTPIETIADKSEEELSWLQDPILVFDSKKWKRKMEKVWQSLQEVFNENPWYFPPEKPVQETFEWAWRLTTTRSFSWEGGMVIPLADNYNHMNCPIHYEREIRQNLEEASKWGEIDYSDFTNVLSENQDPPVLETIPGNKLEKFLQNKANVQKAKAFNAIWDVDKFTSGMRTDSDNESVRNYGDIESSDEDLDEDEDLVVRTPEEIESYYFITITGRSFKKGEEVCISYGRLSNRELLLDYGFCMEQNIYDAYYFRMWKAATGRSGLVSPEEIVEENYKEEHSQAKLDDLTDFISLKMKRFNSEIFTHFRRVLVLSEVPELAHIPTPKLVASPSHPEIELYIADKVLDVYLELKSRFETSLEEDLEMFGEEEGDWMRNCLVYRIGQKRILLKQIDYLNTLIRVLGFFKAGNMENHLIEKTVKELKEVYPLNRYLKSLKANMLFGL